MIARYTTLTHATAPADRDSSRQGTPKEARPPAELRRVPEPRHRAADHVTPARLERLTHAPRRIQCDADCDAAPKEARPASHARGTF